MEPEYRLELESGVGRENVLEFSTADGVPSKNGFRDPELLLADVFEPGAEGGTVLVPRTGYGFLGVAVAKQVPEGEVVMTETGDRAFQLSSLNLERNGIENASCRLTLLEDLEGYFDRIVFAPRSYEPVDIVKNTLADSVELLEEGGRLFIAGDKDSGVNRYSSYLESLEGELEKVAQRDGCRAYRFKKTGKVQPARFDVENRFEASCIGEEAGFVTVDGLFSNEQLDGATRLLIESVELSGGDIVLDLACGYGAIAVFLAKKYGCEVFLSDDSLRATKCAGKNLERNGIQNYHLETADCLEGFTDQKFDVIVSNPPTHQGSGVTDEMIRDSYERLVDGGELYMVYNSNLHLERKMGDVFGDAEKVAERDNFVVCRAVK